MERIRSWQWDGGGRGGTQFLARRAREIKKLKFYENLKIKKAERARI